MCNFFIALFLFLSSLDAKTTWSHIDSFQDNKGKLLSTWAIEDGVIRYCLDTDDILKNTIDDEFFSIEVELAIESWLNNNIINSCGVFNKLGKKVLLKNIKIKRIKNCSDELDVKSLENMSMGGCTYNNKHIYKDYNTVKGDNRHLVIRVQNIYHKCVNIKDFKQPHIFLGLTPNKIKTYTFVHNKNKGKYKRKLHRKAPEMLSYGEDNTFPILLHELGHVFGLADNYTSLGSSSIYRTDYFSYKTIMNPQEKTNKRNYMYNLYKPTQDDLIGLLTIFDRITGNERIYLKEKSGYKKIKLNQIRFYNSTDLYLCCDNSCATNYPLLKKDNTHYLEQNMDNNTIFIKAIEENNKDLLLYILDNKIADINVVFDERTALEYALYFHRFEIAKLLISRGATLSSTLAENITVYKTDHNELKEIIIYLHDNDADLNAFSGKEYESPLFMKLLMFDFDLLKELVENNIINIKKSSKNVSNKMMDYFVKELSEEKKVYLQEQL